MLVKCKVFSFNQKVPRNQKFPRNQVTKPNVFLNKFKFEITNLVVLVIHNENLIINKHL